MATPLEVFQSACESFADEISRALEDAEADYVKTGRWLFHVFNDNRKIDDTKLKSAIELFIAHSARGRREALLHGANEFFRARAAYLASLK